MTEIQQKIALANLMIDHLYKDKPLQLFMSEKQFAMFISMVESSGIDIGFSVKNIADQVRISIDEKNVDRIYHVLSTFIGKHQQPVNSIDQFIASGEFDKAFRDVFGLPSGVVKSLGEVP